MRTKAKFLIALILLVFAGMWCLSAVTLDEILDYEINVTVNEDATLTLKYHVDWKVLDSKTEGPLEWVKIGIPNKHYVSMSADSKTIDRISYLSDGGSHVRIDLDRKYYKDEVASFDFTVVQDNMYQANKFEEGFTVYEFTPGWFDDIKVDRMVVRWANDKMEEWTPSCNIKDGYNVWETSLDKGATFTVTVTYPNDTYAFDLTKTIEDSSDDDMGVGEIIIFIFVAIAALGVLIVILAIGIGIFAIIIYGIGAAFGGNYDKKIKRTKVILWSECPSCGAPREEGLEKCKFCGRSLVKSEEIIKEEQVAEEDKEALKHKRAGLFHYSSEPNTYVRVNVVKVQRPVVRSSYSSSSSRSSSHHSSCVHSSCACACACACAGGGRAGCTAKDFYKNAFPLKYLKKDSD